MAHRVCVALVRPHFKNHPLLSSVQFVRVSDVQPSSNYFHCAAFFIAHVRIRIPSDAERTRGREKGEREERG